MESINFKQDKNFSDEQDNENENFRLKEINEIKYYSSNKKRSICYCYKMILVLSIIIFIFFGILFLSSKAFGIIEQEIIKKDSFKNYKNLINAINQNIYNYEEKEEHLKENNLTNNIINNIKSNITNIIPDNMTDNKNDNMTDNRANIDNINNVTNLLIQNEFNNLMNNNIKKKIGLAFVYKTLYSNGIARFITLTANHFMKTGKYDIYFITSEIIQKEFTYNSNIKRFVAFNNFSLIRNISKQENIDIFILQNEASTSMPQFYRSLGKKVITIFHGVFMSAMAIGGSMVGYRYWFNFDLYDSFAFISPDDYFFYKNLGFKNEIYIPNMLTFEPSETQSSNLTYNNIIMLGRFSDPIKGGKYAIKAMSLIVKEIPDAKLIMISSDSGIQFLRDLIIELNLSNNVFIHSQTYNISSYFLNSSVLMYTSLSEAYPMALNEGKAHGLPIVAFDVPYSVPYQKGVIVVDQLDCNALARETILLLKNYNYRKRMGEFAKKSLYKYSNILIIDFWERLFNALLSGNENDYRKLQFEIEKKYYKEEEARLHLQKSFNYIIKNYKNLSCHTLDNIANTNYLKNIEDCNISNSNISLK